MTHKAQNFYLDAAIDFYGRSPTGQYDDMAEAALKVVKAKMLGLNVEKAEANFLNVINRYYRHGE